MSTIRQSDRSSSIDLPLIHLPGGAAPAASFRLGRVQGYLTWLSRHLEEYPGERQLWYARLSGRRPYRPKGSYAHPKTCRRSGEEDAQ